VKFFSIKAGKEVVTPTINKIIEITEIIFLILLFMKKE